MDNENKKQKDNKKLETKLNSWKEDLKLQKEKALVLKQKSELTPSTSKETKNLIKEQPVFKETINTGGKPQTIITNQPNSIKSTLLDYKKKNNLQITIDKIDKIDKLEEKIEKVQFIISDYIIDNLTEATAKKNDLLDERINLESQIISKFKNFMIKFLTFGCYDKNKKTKNKLKKNKIELDKAINNEAKFLKEYETAKSIILKLMEKIRNLKNASALGFEKDKSKVNSEVLTSQSQNSSSKSQKM